MIKHDCRVSEMSPPSPPCETVRDIMEERDWTVGRLAQHMNWPVIQAFAFLRNELPIGLDLAKELAAAFPPAPVTFWLRRQALYLLTLAEQERGSHLRETSSESPDWQEEFAHFDARVQLCDPKITAGLAVHVDQEGFILLGPEDPEEALQMLMEVTATHAAAIHERPVQLMIVGARDESRSDTTPVAKA